MSPITNIKKRDGRVVEFDQSKIAEAIWKAAKSVGGSDKTIAEKIANQVTAVIEVFFKGPDSAPSVEQIQDLVEKILIEGGHAKTAKAYILYREKQARERSLRSRSQHLEECIELDIKNLSTDQAANINIAADILTLIKKNIAEYCQTHGIPLSTATSASNIPTLTYKLGDKNKNITIAPAKAKTNPSSTPNEPAPPHAKSASEQRASEFILPPPIAIPVYENVMPLTIEVADGQRAHKGIKLEDKTEQPAFQSQLQL